MTRVRLSSLDGSFLRVESPTAHMHVAWKGRFAPPPHGSVTLEALRASVAAAKGGGAATPKKPAARKKHSLRNEDARHCLEKSSNEEIIKCAEAYL